MVDPQYLPGVREMSAKQAKARTSINLSYAAPRGIVTTNVTRDVALYHGENGFSVHKGDTLYQIEVQDMDQMARQVTKANWTTKFAGVGFGLFAMAYVTKKTVDGMNHMATEVAPGLMKPGSYSCDVMKKSIDIMAGQVSLGIPKDINDVTQNVNIRGTCALFKVIVPDNAQLMIGEKAAPAVMLVTNAARYKHLSSFAMRTTVTKELVPLVTANLTAPAEAYLQGVEAVAQFAKVAGEAAPTCSIL